MNVKTIVGQLCERPAVPASSRFADRLAQRWRLSDFFELTKPRVMLLAVFTAVVGLISAGGQLNSLQALVAVLSIAAGAGAAGALNMWYDADIDAVMARTAMRPIPRGRVSKVEALVFGVVLGATAVVVLALAANLTAAALLAGTILFYVAVYTAWLKRSTRQNIVIGGAAGAAPPVIGWAAATGDIGLEPLALFLIIFLWTPPHFWALALNRTDDYFRAGVPMLPVVAGKAATTRQILIYSGLLVVASELPWALGYAGTAYGAIAAIFGALFLLLAGQLNRSAGADRPAAQRLFLFSISYLFVLFGTLLIERGPESFSSMRSSHEKRTLGSAHADLAPGTVRSACCTFNFSEV
ncbi:heme o synthase [Bradyrhizobium sp. JYMT SZCCT0428]|uniref:heme o synthase n=1 Tax=Bradyrhizobium sp. JYMT SZCCT0428 TaxID=2807673 RepID=UPI001BAC8E3E|nr:heme o synthase [Bradyrhizobium sp. JYMT SZCCT0428]MBR1154013.1 protoheme IX farnesyltransferase [Bradyrhizobium sp. JYMT SZCCT0428]